MHVVRSFSRLLGVRLYQPGTVIFAVACFGIPCTVTRIESQSQRRHLFVLLIVGAPCMRKFHSNGLNSHMVPWRFRTVSYYFS